MGQNVAQNLIAAHLVSGDLTASNETSLGIDQTLTDRPADLDVSIPWLRSGWLATGG